uniref:Dicer-2 n=1 Tax=Anopheles farauti TaxID=69004 RepID=A0A182PZN5_9DIPT
MNAKMETNKQPVMEDFSPRDYQVQMKDVCLAKNTIIYLPTGSGKTYIALMVMKEMSHQLRNEVGSGGKRTFFLANTVALAKQQAQFFCQHMPFSVRLYTSEVNVDAWKSDRWFQEFSEVQVISAVKKGVFVATSQILLDVLRHGYLTPANINLIVFDECHRAVGQHPMHAIMKEIVSAPANDRPRIIGLSGTLLFKELKMAQQVPEELERLENTFSATIAAVANDETFETVRSFSTNPNELLIPYHRNTVLHLPLVTEVLQKVQEFLNQVLLIHLPEYATQSGRTLLKGLTTPVKEIKKALLEFEYHLQELGIYPGSIAILSVIVQLEISKRNAPCDKSRHLFRGAISFCDRIHHALVNVMSGFSRKKQILSFSSDQCQKLIKYLEDSYRTGEDEKKQAIIFVKRRFTAKILHHLIKLYFQSENDSKDEPLVKPDFIVGINATLEESIETILAAKIDRRVIERFRKHKINVLCATNVLEEGIDLQMCNMVIMFDAPVSYSSFVQSKGRARMSTSNYVLMIPQEDRVQFVKRIQLYRAIESRLKEELVGKTINRAEPLETDVNNELANDLITPFITPNGAKLDALSAIQLLNRYCMSLPNDLFTSSNVVWKRIDTSATHVTVTVKLPLQSTVRETISGVPMRKLRLAKQSAAFNACKRLYEVGELNMFLLPVTSNAKVEELSDQYFNHWRKMSEESDPRKAGTTKYVRGHKIVYPIETVDCTPQADGEECFVYIIRMRPQLEASARIENVRIFERLYGSANNFGILTRKPLPVLAKMVLFVTLGPIGVEVVPEPVRLTLAPASGQLRRLMRFHLLLFRDLLRVWKPFTVLDGQAQENGFIIVPMVRSEAIDWELIERFPFLRPATEASVRARQQLQFEPERYQLRVVHPWYKNDPEQNYVVIRVHEHLRPSSPFPSEKYRSFEDYFEQEHHQVVVRHDDQFLIEVKGITTSLNRLHPGGEADGGASTRSRYWEFQELLIPELVHNYEFPADYWLKATLLPSTLHRVHYLLLAEGIRLDLATKAQIGSVCCDQLADVTVDRIQSIVGQKASQRPQELEDNDDDDDDDDLECGGESTSEEEEDGDQKQRYVAPSERPRGAQLRAILQQIHTEAPAITDKLVYPWEENDEPLDLNRNIHTVGKIDIDYHVSFLKKHTPNVQKIAKDINHSMTHTNIDKMLAELDLDRDERKPANGAAGGHGLLAIDDGGVGGQIGEIAMLKLTYDNTANVPLQQADILMALTTKSSGDVFNLERCEVLGDAFLKFAVSVYILCRHTSWHEGYLTACKGRMVSNRNLLYCAMRYGLAGKIKVYPYDPKNDWVPPLSSVPGPVRDAMVKANETPSLLYKLSLTEEEVMAGRANQSTIDAFLPLVEQNEQPSRSTLQSVLGQVQIADKVVADATEALLGVCVKTVGYERSFRFLSHLGIIPKGSDVPMLLRTTNYPIADYFPIRDQVDRLLCNPDRIEAVLGYRFRNRTYLLQAFTHASYTSHSLTTSYQQLEFLGDAVLDFLISMYIFERNPTMTPGQLTDLRSALVNNVNLACVLVRAGLHLHILSQSPMLTDAIGKFVRVQNGKHNQIGEWSRLLTEESDTAMAEYVEIPKVLGDVFESLIGAIYLDSGYDLSVCWRVCYRLLRDEIANFTLDTPIQVVRQLYEHPEAKPHFSKPIVEDEVVYVKLSYTHRSKRQKVYGFGKNKEDARRAAAKIALNRMK